MTRNRCAEQDWASHLFRPHIFLSVAAFAFFINVRVGISVGLAQIMWVAMCGWLMASGVAFSNDRFAVGAEGSALRFGGYVGITLMLLYFGRRHYGRVAVAAMGLRRFDDTPGSAVWAARCMVLSLCGATWLLCRFGGADMAPAALLIAIVMCFLLVLARINVETGLFYAQPAILPIAILAGFFGVEGIGVEGMLVLTFASLVLVADPREAITPYLANGLAMCERIGHVPPRRSVPWLALLVVVGLAVSVAVTLTIQYNRGISQDDGWAKWLGVAAFDRAANAARQLDAYGELQAVTAADFLSRLSMARPNPTTLTWCGIGLGLVLLCGWGRIRFANWPIHPIAFVIMGTYPSNRTSFSFLIGALLKWATIRFGGERAFKTVLPLMIGVVAAELAMICVWSIVGGVYFHRHGITPPVYRILPG